MQYVLHLESQYSIQQQPTCILLLFMSRHVIKEEIGVGYRQTAGLGVPNQILSQRLNNRPNPPLPKGGDYSQIRPNTPARQEQLGSGALLRDTSNSIRRSRGTPINRLYLLNHRHPSQKNTVDQEEMKDKHNVKNCRKMYNEKYKYIIEIYRKYLFLHFTNMRYVKPNRKNVFIFLKCSYWSHIQSIRCRAPRL